MSPFNTLLLLTSIFAFSTQNKVSYSIQADSKVLLDLSTNITKVSCRCLDNVNFAPNQSAEYTGNTGSLKFLNTTMKLDVNKINCKNKNINNDLRETLSADKYPQIELELLSINSLHNISEMEMNVPKYFDAGTSLTIAGKKLPQRIKTTVVRTGKDTFRLYAAQAISLDAYEIVPKSPIKFIKIHDKATVTMDLLIKVKN